MKALVLERSKSAVPKLRLRDVPKPKPGPHDALLRVLACGLCHHDKLAIEGTLRRGIPSSVILGHEICGEVEEVGSEVTLIQPGQRVVPLLTEACGSCERCYMGREHRCLNGKGIGHGIDGGFAPYVRVRETALVPIPHEIPPEQACLLTCPIGVAVQGAEDVGKISAGDWVMVTGASGGLGSHALQIAKVLGAKTIGVTTSEGKLASLIELGADDVVPVGELDFVEIVRALTAEEGANVILDTVGSQLFPSLVRALAQYGRIVMLGEVASGKTDFSLPELLFRDGSITGSTGAQIRHTKRAAELVAEGMVKPVIHARLPLRDVLTGVGWMAEKRLFGRIVLSPE